jgi:hypothetical protein
MKRRKEDKEGRKDPPLESWAGEHLVFIARAARIGLSERMLFSRGEEGG